MLTGDLVYNNIQASTAWHSTYFYLAQDAIEITDANNVPYYSLTEILQKDGHPLRTEKFLAMQNEIHLAGERLKKSGDKIKVEEGPQKDKLVSEVMQNADTLTVWFYIYDLTQKSWDNMGQTIRLADGFYAYAK